MRDLVLVLRAAGTDNLPRGTRVRVRVVSTDLLTLDVHGALVTRLDDAGAEAAPEPEAEGDDEAAGPLTLAIALDDPAPSSDKDAVAP